MNSSYLDITYSFIGLLLKELMHSATSELKDMLEICAVLRWFNEESIAALWESERVPKVYELVRNYDFVHQGRYGLELHDRVRDFINQDLRRRVPTRYKRLHQLASEYYGRLLNENTVQDRRVLLLEKLYHKLRADEKEGMIELRTVFSDAALLIQPDLCQVLIEVAEGASLQDEVHQLWLEHFKGSLARQQSDFVEAERIFSQLAQNPLIEQDKELKAELYFYWGVTLWYVCRFSESKAASEEALKLNQHLRKIHFENRALGAIGLAQDRMGEFQNALITVTRMVTQSRKTGDRISEAYGLNSTGYFSWHTGEWDKAEEALLQCRQVWIDLGSKFGECYPLGHLGRLYADINFFSAASDYLNLALSLAINSGNREMEIVVLINLTALEIYKKDYQRAAEYAERALILTQKMDHKYFEAETLNLQGDISKLIGQPIEAFRKYSDSLKISEKIHAPWVTSKNLVALYALKHYHRKIRFTYTYKDLTIQLEEQNYYDQLARLQLIHANWVILHQNDANKAIKYYETASLSALRHNWHYLDKVVQVLIDQSHRLGELDRKHEAKEILMSMISYWKSTDFKGTPLTVLETTVPRIRKGDAEFQSDLISRLSFALDEI